METTTNSFGEEVTKWESTKHPDSPDFMQIVTWKVWVKPDGRVLVGYNLGANSKTKFIYGISKEDAIRLYS